MSPIFPIFISGFLFAFVYQQVDALRRQRDEKLRELKEVTEIRRREPELQNLQSQISGLENRLKFSKRDKEVTVSTYLSHAFIYMYVVAMPNYIA